jgi:25S rRNA (uracil2634-N3)-methyltransferase
MNMTTSCLSEKVSRAAKPDSRCWHSGGPCPELMSTGDFSFALSLTQHHKVAAITATCYDSAQTLHEKYPGVQSTIAKLTGAHAAKRSSTDHDARNSNKDADNDDDAREGFSTTSSLQSYAGDEDTELEPPLISPSVTVMYDIDATKLSTTHKKVLRKSAPFSKIVFSFPHTGGLSTDVNRQVRYNQELLVGFFKNAKPLLCSLTWPVRTVLREELFDEGDEFKDEGRSEVAPKNGQILVTLFEGEPYSLWNIRDLARHSGLRVVESFRFPWSSYPGYQHARTIGDITTGKDRSDEGKRKGAWRGEERDARCYVMEDQQTQSDQPFSKNKRKRGEDRHDGSDSE